MTHNSLPNARVSAGFGSKEDTPSKSQVCQGLDCDAEFKPRTNKRFCSNACRSKAADLQKIERMRQVLARGEITEEDVKRFAKIYSSKHRRPEKKPVKLCKSHRDLLEWIDNHDLIMSGPGGPPTKVQNETFCPALDRNAPLSWGRRARELRELGLLESFKIGRFTVFRRLKE